MSCGMFIGAPIVADTINYLRASSLTECVVLWLGRREEETILVTEVFLPRQNAEADYFHIPRLGMEELLSYLRANRLMVAAQVHTHPGEAFHSEADDRWAIVRHRGALSLVVPRFCRETSAATFYDDALVFQIDSSGVFVPLPARDTYEVTP